MAGGVLAVQEALPEGHFLFTSESVGEGHPDKLCDVISDSVLDACLAQDPRSRVACEAAAKTGMVVLLGEIRTRAAVDLQGIVRRTLRRVGYDAAEKGMDWRSCSVLVSIESQSPDIARAVDGSADADGDADEDCTGAGDQGIMFGYATDETPERMPLTCVLAHRLTRRLAALRRCQDMAVGDAACAACAGPGCGCACCGAGSSSSVLLRQVGETVDAESGAPQTSDLAVAPLFWWLRPDCKAQVTVEYRLDADGVPAPVRVHTVVLSAQHAPDADVSDVRGLLVEHVVRAAIPAALLDARTVLHVQPSGRFVVGGPQGDAGLTGRKVVVDAYGGWGAHGGGAFSGKDWTKVDRSGAYAARWAAVSLVAAGLARRVLIQLSYAIGVAEPLAIHVDHYGTGTRSAPELARIVARSFDLRPGAIARALGLRRPIFAQTAVFGHFGRAGFPWERPKDLALD